MQSLCALWDVKVKQERAAASRRGGRRRSTDVGTASDKSIRLRPQQVTESQAVERVVWQRIVSVRRMLSPHIPPRATLEFTTLWTRHRLKAMRNRGDPLADACVAELHRTSGLTNIRDLLGVVRERTALGDATFAAFVHDINRVPAWLDKELVQEGCNVLAAYLLPMYPSLLAGSLVGGAMFKQMALVTYLAGSMTANPSRRIGETGSMIARLAFGVEALLPGGTRATRACSSHLMQAHGLCRGGARDAGACAFASWWPAPLAAGVGALQGHQGGSRQSARSGHHAGPVWIRQSALIGAAGRFIDAP